MMPSNRFELVAIILSLTIIFSVTLPAVSALTPRDVSIIKDYIITDKYAGGQRVCGDHLCSASEWNAMKHALQTHIHKSITCQDLKKWKACETVATQKP
jgi:hypothetical protein